MSEGTGEAVRWQGREGEGGEPMGQPQASSDRGLPVEAAPAIHANIRRDSPHRPAPCGRINSRSTPVGRWRRVFDIRRRQPIPPRRTDARKNHNDDDG
jgi:hypothetical protein